MKRLLILFLSLAALCNVAEARVVSGSVTCGKSKLSDVIVTDGKNFTKTQKGKFKFKIDDNAEFVYIVTPSGYVADWSNGVPAFYQAAAGKDKFNFELTKTKESAGYSIVAIADPQPRGKAHFAKFTGKPLEDLCQTTKGLENIAVGLVLGDICWDNLELLENYKSEIVRTGIPFYPVVGNHDHDRNAQGDLAATAAYRSSLGPENYAFYLGNDVVIVVDNIIYDTDKKYKEGYADHVLAWVKNLVDQLPEDADLYIAQHSPLYHWDIDFRIVNSQAMLDIVKGHETNFISGHTHINNILEYGDNVKEHNVAAICGSWWDTLHTTDGTPRGYKVFTKENDELTWYYKSVGQPKDFQVEFFDMGQAPFHPNSVVANVWDWDPQWKVEWYQDDKYMGELKPVNELSPIYCNEIHEAYNAKGEKAPNYKKSRVNYHYFAATPSQYAKNVKITVKSRFGQSWSYDFNMTDYVDVQAHRGGAGRVPENTIEAMKYSLDLGVNTLELDLQISKDGQVVVSHDPYFHSRYGIRPDGSHIMKEDPKEYIYTMDYELVKKYDVGSRPSSVWPEKACFPTVKPLATDLIDFVENYVKEKGYSPVRYNIEVKSKDAEGEGVNWPEYKAFADACIELLMSKNLGDRLVVQCFDTRTLNYMHEKYPSIIYSYLVDAKVKDFDVYMSKLNFTPVWLSPHYTIVDEELVKKCKEMGIKLVPWTVDKPEDIKRMIDLKVEAIISNYPDRLIEQTRGCLYEITKLKRK